MAFLKFIHVLCIFVWIGSLMSLTRLMGYHVKEDVDTQMRLAKLYKRVYNFVEFPCMVVAVVLGLFLMTNLDFSYKPGWFHMKLTFAIGMVACDLACGHFVRRLNVEPDLSNGKKYKMLHGMTGLMLILILLSSLVVRDKAGEIVHRYEQVKQVGKNSRTFL